MDTQRTINLARRHIGKGAAMESSARLCLEDAVRLYDAGNYPAARARAIRSMGYTIGILHPDYIKAVRTTLVA
jgi:hypothetical protein